ncbi:MAG: hypothetical protein AAGG51_20165 [Cyanobacteria bacterium P01_G01_bin.54]
MSNFILLDGDTVNFLPNFGPAMVQVQSGTLQGTGKGMVMGQAICIEGDETAVAVPGCPYTAGAYSVPGSGTLKIAALAADQIATKTHSLGPAVLLQGSQFTAQFEVQTPAQQPPPAATPDPNLVYQGQGSFTTTNTKWTAV